MRRAVKIFNAVLLATFSIAAYGGQDAGAPSKPDAGYRLGPRDGLTILVWGHEDLSGKYSIAADGSLSFPLVGSIKAADRTVPEVQAEPEWMHLPGPP